MARYSRTSCQPLRPCAPPNENGGVLFRRRQQMPTVFRHLDVSNLAAALPIDLASGAHIPSDSWKPSGPHVGSIPVDIAGCHPLTPF